jgi:CHAT domain-containing protein
LIWYNDNIDTSTIQANEINIVSIKGNIDTSRGEEITGNNIFLFAIDIFSLDYSQGTQNISGGSITTSKIKSSGVVGLFAHDNVYTNQIIAGNRLKISSLTGSVNTSSGSIFTTASPSTVFDKNLNPTPPKDLFALGVKIRAAKDITTADVSVSDGRIIMSSSDGSINTQAGELVIRDILDPNREIKLESKQSIITGSINANGGRFSSTSFSNPPPITYGDMNDPGGGSGQIAAYLPDTPSFLASLNIPNPDKLNITEEKTNDPLTENKGSIDTITTTPIISSCQDSNSVLDSRAYINDLDLFDESKLDSQQIIQCFEQNLALAKQQQNVNAEEIALYNLGVGMFRNGNYPLSRDYYEQNIKLINTLGNSQPSYPQIKGLSTAGLGTVYSALGEYPKSINQYNQSRDLLPKNTKIEAFILRNLGLAYLNQSVAEKPKDSLENAFKYLNDSLKISQSSRDRKGEGKSLGYLGRAYFAQGNYDKAIEQALQHLKIARETADQRSEGQALHTLGWAHYAKKDFQIAVKFQQEYLEISRKLKDRAAEGQALIGLGDALVQADRSEEAIKPLGKAIEVWESLRQKLGNHDLDKVSIFETQATTYTTLQEALIAQKNLPGKVEMALEIAERGRAQAFVESLKGKIQSTATQRSEPISIAQMKQIAKQKNTTLVEYSVILNGLEISGQRQNKATKIYIWVVHPDGTVTHRNVPLPPDINLAQLVEQSRTEIGARNRSNFRIEGHSSNSTDRLKQLHQLLIAPIADLLPTDPNAHVTFVPHSELFLVPFPALQDSSGKYLIEQHTILTAPAIQVLNLTHQKRQQVERAGLNEVLIIGNPKMPQLTRSGQQPETLSALPDAEREANQIARLLKTKPWVGGQATKAAIIPKLPQSRIIHMATHGFLDDLKELGTPGAIALAPDGTGQPNDGFLTADEILALKLNAELIVLSACNTGGGRITSDSVIGLSRSLIIAGTSSVVVSLWSVPDAPTAGLMTEFYQNWQEKKLDKAQALRQAMLTIMKRPTTNPVDWAAFTLIGESE